jgi:hypothetical protein
MIFAAIENVFNITTRVWCGVQPGKQVLALYKGVKISFHDGGNTDI